MRTEFPVTDEAIKALRIRVLRDLSAAPYPREALPYIAQEQRISHEDAKALVEKHGWPDRGAMGRAADVLEGKREPDPAGPKPGPKPKPVEPPVLTPNAPEKPQEIIARRIAADTAKPTWDTAKPTWDPPANTTQLLRAGDKSAKARTRRLAEKVRADLRTLSDLVAAERKETEAAKAQAKAAAEQEAKLLEEIAELQARIDERKKLLRRLPAARSVKGEA